jgi:hypothetical protein
VNATRECIPAPGVPSWVVNRESLVDRALMLTAPSYRQHIQASTMLDLLPNVVLSLLPGCTASNDESARPVTRQARLSEAWRQ